MSKKNRGRPPEGSDAARAAEIDGPALPPAHMDDAAENAEHVEEANEQSAEPAEFNEPDTIDALVGGDGALPNHLEPAAENARKAERVSEMQAEMAARPENPNEVKREHLRKIASYLGKTETAVVLSRYFGTDDVERVGVHNLDIAIDELHKAADEKDK